jgi:hypothetical protein
MSETGVMPVGYLGLSCIHVLYPFYILKSILQAAHQLVAEEASELRVLAAGHEGAHGKELDMLPEGVREDRGELA